MMSSKRKNSSLWTQFTEEIDSKKAKCKYCSTLISIAGGSNGNLIRHMKTKHALIPLTIERQPLLDASDLSSQQSNEITAVNVISTSSSVVSTSSSVSALPQLQQSITQYIRKPPPIRKVQEIDRQVVKMVAKGHHALRIVEELEMRKLIEMVSHCPGYQLPSRKTSLNLMSNVYNEVLILSLIHI